MKPVLLAIIFLLFIIPISVKSQEISNNPDSIPSRSRSEPLKFNRKALIIPGSLILYGIIETAMPENVRLLNYGIGHEMKTHVKKRMTLDDFTQYTPMVSVYALDLVGVKAKHNFRDRTLILGMSAAFMGVTVNSVKYTVRKQRPDGSARNSFPSGHAAMAFMGAEFLYQEYRHESIWYGIAGYTVATGTAFFRMYNNRHWFGDIAAGAGIGILSTKLSYWIYPSIQRMFDNKNGSHRPKNNMAFAPYYNGNQWGISLSLVR